MAATNSGAGMGSRLVRAPLNCGLIRCCPAVGGVVALDLMTPLLSMLGG